MDPTTPLSVDAEQPDAKVLRRSARRKKVGRIMSADKQQVKGKGALARALSRTSADSVLRSSHDSDGHAAAPDDDDDDMMLAVCDEDELRDLAFTFTACDIDNSNSMEVGELHAMLVIQCNSITEQQVDSLMRAGKAHYEKWYAEAASDVDHDVVVRRMMRVAGLDSGNRTKHGAVRTFAELKFEDKAKPMNAAQLLDSTVGLAAAVIDQTVDSTVNKAAAAIDQTASAISIMPTVRAELPAGEDEESAVPRLPPQSPSTGHSLEGLTLIEDEDAELERSLSFPEYVFTMQCKELHDVMDFDARKLAIQMRAFRNAFDAVDVDGHNLLEYDDLEIVTLTLNPRLLLSEDDLLGLWQVVTENAIVRHVETTRREADAKLRKQRKQEVKAIDQKLIALDDVQVQLEKRLKLRFSQEVTPTEETWLRKEISRVCAERDSLLPGRQELIDAVLKPDPEPEPEPEPQPGLGAGSEAEPESPSIRGLENASRGLEVVQIEGLIKCQYGRKGEFETVWIAVSSDGSMVVRDITGMPPGFQGTWQGTVLRKANVVQSSVRDQKLRRSRSKTQRQAIRIDLVAEDSCGDKKYAMRSIPKKKQKSSNWMNMTQFRKALETFAVVRWDDTRAIALNFNEFLHGMASAQQNERTAKWINVFEPNRWELLSLIIDTPVGEVEAETIFQSLSAIEKVGVDILRRKRQDMDMDRVRCVLTKAANGALSALDNQQRDNMKSVHRNAVLSCAIIGFIFAAMAALIENGLVAILAIDGLKDAYWVCTVESQLDTSPNSTTFGLFAPIFPDLANPDEMLCSTIHVNASTCTGNFLDKVKVLSNDDISHGNGYYPPGTDEERADNFGWTTLDQGSESMAEICGACECAVCGCATHAPVVGRVEMGFDNKQALFWGVLAPMIGFTVGMEIFWLLYCAMRYTTLVAWALDFRLIPLNKDRVFVAGSLIRAAFEMGNPDSPLLGVDPQQEEGSGNKLLVVIVFKLKVFLTSVALKLIIGLTFSRSTAVWVKPWLGMVLSTVVWDAYTCHSVMVQARIRGFGVYASVELFNDIMDTMYQDATNVAATVPFFSKIQIARAIGVAIVVHGSLHPSMELLLRHSLQFLGLVGTRVVASPGILDDRNGFLDDLAENSSRGNPIYEVPGDASKKMNSWMLASRDPEDAVKVLSHADKTAVLCVHLLAFVLDGYLDPEELELWKVVCSAVGAPRLSIPILGGY